MEGEILSTLKTILKKLDKLNEDFEALSNRQAVIDEKLVRNFQLTDTLINNTKTLITHNHILNKYSDIGKKVSIRAEAPIPGSAVKASGEINPNAKVEMADMTEPVTQSNSQSNSQSEQIERIERIERIENTEKIEPEPEKTGPAPEKVEAEVAEVKPDPIKQYFIEKLISGEEVITTKNGSKIGIMRIVSYLKVQVSNPITPASAADAYDTIADMSNKGVDKFKSVYEKLIETYNTNH